MVQWDATEYGEKSRENLAVAEVALEQKASDAAASRAYYAAFHAAIRGLLVYTPFRPDRWDHGVVQAHVASDLVRSRKLLSRDLAGALSELIAKRHVADYGPGRVGIDKARRLVGRAREFVEAVAGSGGPGGL